MPPLHAPLNHQEVNTIDFGDMYVNENRQKFITIENLGNFNFDFVIKKKNG